MGGGSLQRSDEVRHAYLHFHLDNLVARNITKIENGSSLLSLIAKTEDVEPAYVADFHILATESLIRAIELRMDRVPSAVARERIDNYYRTGLLLLPRFYELLEAYETNQTGIRDYFTTIAQETALLRNPRCAEAWVSANDLGLMQQLGAIPEPQQAA